jgi:hypothetical protein
MLKDGIDDYGNQDKWLHRNNNFSPDQIVNIDVVGDESTLLEIPLSKTGKYMDHLISRFPWLDIELWFLVTF